MAYEKLTKEDYAIAASNGISKTAAYRRYEIRYWSKEDAITLPMGTKRKVILTKEDYEIAKSNGIPKQTAYQRRTRLGWPVERCITEPILEERFYWKEWEKIATDNGITYEAFRKRVQTGLAHEVAATATTKELRQRKKSL